MHKFIALLGMLNPVFKGRLFFALLILLLLWTAWWYKDTIGSLIAIWSRSATFTHGFLVLPISLWLVWRKRAELVEKTPQPSMLFLLVLTAAGCIWLLGIVVDANAVIQFGFIAVLVSAIVAVLGKSITITLGFPLAFLFFAVPTGEFLLPHLMRATADFTVLALRLTGIPVHREGLQFVIPTGNWSVVEACSGIRYLIASITVGSLFAYLNYRSWWRRLVFVGISIFVPIVANWLRAYFIVLIGHVSNNRFAAGLDHLVYGWVFFGIVLTAMFFIGMRWSEKDVEIKETKMLPVIAFHDFRFSFKFWSVITTAFVLIAVPPLAAGLINQRSESAEPVLAQLKLPEEINGGWRRVEGGLFDRRQVDRLSWNFVQAAYQLNDATVYFLISQEEGTFRSSEVLNLLAPGSEADTSLDLQPAEDRIKEIPCGDRLVRVNKLDFTFRQNAGIDFGSEKYVALQFFFADNKTALGLHVARLFQQIGRLKNKPNDIFSIYFLTPKFDAETRLSEFVNLNCSLFLERVNRTVLLPISAFVSRVNF